MPAKASLSAVCHLIVWRPQTGLTEREEAATTGKEGATPRSGQYSGRPFLFWSNKRKREDVKVKQRKGDEEGRKGIDEKRRTGNSHPGQNESNYSLILRTQYNTTCYLLSPRLGLALQAWYDKVGSSQYPQGVIRIPYFILRTATVGNAAHPAAGRNKARPGLIFLFLLPA